MQINANINSNRKKTMKERKKERKTMQTKLIPETVHYRSFESKLIWNHLYPFIFCIIYLESSTKVFSTI